MGTFFFWLPKKDLNPHKQIQSLSCYHYTIRQYGPLRFRNGDIISRNPEKSRGIFRK